MSGPTRHVRLHIRHLPNSDPFPVTRTTYEQACQRHPKLAMHLDTTIGDSLEDFHPAIVEAEVLISDTNVLREQFPANASNLKWVYVTSAGVDSLLPLDWLPAGAVLVNNSGTHTQKAAEFACTAILMLNGRIPNFVTNQQRARWTPLYTTGVSGKTLAVIGVGNIGSAAARLSGRPLT